MIRLDDVRIRLADSLAHAQSGVALAIDPANLDKGTHTITKGSVTLAITDGIRLVAQAGADDFIDLGAGCATRRRSSEAQATRARTSRHRLIRAGVTGVGTDDVILQSAILETGIGPAGGVLVHARSGPAPIGPAIYFTKYYPDGAGGSGGNLDVGFFGGSAPGVAIKGTYNFVNPAGNTAGLIANGSATTGNIIVTAKNSLASDPQVNVSGITDILGTGHIDVLTNGFITLTEQVGDMQVGDIDSTAGDVTLTSPQSIVDGDPADDAFGLLDPADVTGVNITLKAVAGGIGSAGNFLETNLRELTNDENPPVTGVLKADAPQSIFIEETAGDLRVHHVISTAGDVTLVGRAGSIVDGHDDKDANGVANTFEDADERCGTPSTSPL